MLGEKSIPPDPKSIPPDPKSIPSGPKVYLQISSKIVWNFFKIVFEFAGNLLEIVCKFDENCGEKLGNLAGKTKNIHVVVASWLC